MSNVISVDFRKDINDLPIEYGSLWLTTNPKPYFEKSEIELNITHIRFKVYQTESNYAMQFHYGVGLSETELPQQVYRKKPIYKKDINDIWQAIFNELEVYKAEIPYKIRLIKRVLS